MFLDGDEEEVASDVTAPADDAAVDAPATDAPATEEVAE